MGMKGSKAEQHLKDAYAGESPTNPATVHSARFESTPAQRQAVRTGAAFKLGGDHTHKPAHLSIAPETRASLAGDLQP